MRFLNAVFMFTLVVFLSPGVLQAHKVNLFAYEEGGIVITESYFGDGTPCREAKITARNGDGTLVAEGVTDEEGAFSFPYGKGGDLHIFLRASLGHGARIILATDGNNDVSGSTKRGNGASSLKERGQITPPVSAEEVDRIVESRIAPLRDSLREIRKKLEKPTFAKVVGGIGWIVGIAGAYLWGVSRKRN